MSKPFPLQITAGRFPINYTDTPYNVFKFFLRRLRAVITGIPVNGVGSLIPGYTGIIKPFGNVGPWWYDDNLGNTFWMLWSDILVDYTNPEHKFGDANFQIVFLADPNGIKNVFTGSTAISLRLPEQTDISASGAYFLRVLDVYVPRATIILVDPSTGKGLTAPAITWTSTSIDDYDGTSSDDYLLRLSDNTTFTFSGANDGQVKHFAVENNATSFTVTFPPSAQYPNGTQPTQPVGSVGIDAFGRWTFIKINGAFYGWLTDSTPSLPNPSVPTGGSTLIPNSYVPPADHLKQPY